MLPAGSVAAILSVSTVRERLNSRARTRELKRTNAYVLVAPSVRAVPVPTTVVPRSRTLRATALDTVTSAFAVQASEHRIRTINPSATSATRYEVRVETVTRGGWRSVAATVALGVGLAVGTGGGAGGVSSSSHAAPTPSLVGVELVRVGIARAVVDVVARVVPVVVAIADVAEVGRRPDRPDPG